MRWIREYRLPNPQLCEELIVGFKRARELGFAHPGLSARGVDPRWKDSEDASLTCLPFETYASAVRAYREHVMTALQRYLKEFPVLTEQGSARLGFLEPPQIQHYKPGGGFHGAHYESSGLDLGHRVLAFQTYLNDIAEGGGTYFLYQDHTVRPERGKTVIWPAAFTHTHRGEVAPKEEKYIITGWISFIGG
jgi:hypothetical protein